MRRTLLICFFTLATGMISAQTDTMYIQVGIEPVKTYLVSQIDSITFYLPVTAIETTGKQMDQPANFDLLQNFPNPFNPSTIIQFNLPAAGKVQVKIFDLNGSMIRELFKGEKQAGNYSYQWDGKDLRGVTIASGVYLCLVQFNNSFLSKKMIYLK
ncbi:MAG: T9SS type A sorting domain-containing protein [Ignavibacteriaceae bacterium]|nr:T9SS type A sorting domain-containing protein [Ignavibacteriaceae bacterium]